MLIEKVNKLCNETYQWFQIYHQIEDKIELLWYYLLAGLNLCVYNYEILYTHGVLHWDVNFIRVVQDWELETLLNFLDMIYGASAKGSGEDKLCCKPDKNKGFTVSGCYRVLLGNGDQSFPWKSIWKSSF